MVKPLGSEGKMPEIYSPVNTAYEKKQQEEALTKKRDEMTIAIRKVQGKLTEGCPSILHLMDLVEELIHACGGESKVQFTEVSSKFLRIYTRVPMEANIYQFLPESESNPRFHKVVTKTLLMCPEVDGVRWMPSDRGAYLQVVLK